MKVYNDNTTKWDCLQQQGIRLNSLMSYIYIGVALIDLGLMTGLFGL